MDRILVVAAHPDDEILGVGATVAKRVSQGDEAYAVILGEGQTSRWTSRAEADERVVKSLHEDSIRACAIAGYKKVFFEKLPDNRFDSVDLLNIVKVIERYVYELKPSIVYTHHKDDLNIDHRITYQAVLTSTRPIGNYSVKEIYAFETVSATEWNMGSREYAFVPNCFVDVSDTIKIKMDAMREYQSELREFPHPRSLEMLEITAKRWGSIIGKEYAEVFETIRVVD